MTRREGAGKLEGSLLPCHAVGPFVRDGTIHGLADHRCDGHSPSARRAPQSSHLLFGQGDLRPDHVLMISLGAMVMYTRGRRGRASYRPTAAAEASIERYDGFGGRMGDAPIAADRSFFLSHSGNSFASPSWKYVIADTVVA